ncbi:MAG: 3-oxoacyl-[acyl-carrier protein] reductase [Brockia lithotrophica]|uniref:3-oxoacyl-[acyl-carrier-protein] reductase n=1 Tax=Brockia lithotrophica TaxID=933949 RepID=A0A2T5G7I4_9BACL|nr:MAG: 3-oxoacyl-[acyl-carrier protein] reductase [Brockia lithotrophica]
MELAERVALVTGASRGIGRAIALELARGGARVLVVYRGRRDAAEAVVEEIRGLGSEAFAEQGDVARPEEAERLVSLALDRFGRLDILVNNAGITRDNLLLRMKDEEWEEVLRTNLSGPFYLMRAAAKHMMRARRGRIVNIASVVGLVGNPGQANYAAAKAGLIGLTKAAAKELASRGITVNAVAPGYIQTDMTESLPEAAKEALLRLIPAGRFGSPEDVARAVRFLAGDDAAYITGHVLVVDGGMVT